MLLEIEHRLAFEYDAYISESFMELRRNAGLSLAATKRVEGAMAAGLFDLEPH